MGVRWAIVMVWQTTITMTTDFLTLTQWLSPAFPLGSFAYSHGLETVIAQGKVKDAQGLRNWLEALLRYGTGRTDAILLNCSMASEDVSDVALALVSSSERLQETLAQGRAFAATYEAMTGRPLPKAPLPVVVGVAARGLDVAERTVTSLYLQNFASNLVTIAVRFIPLGQSEGQRVLGELAPTIADVAEDTLGASVDGLGVAAFAADLAAMVHETQEVRLFKT